MQAGRLLSALAMVGLDRPAYALYGAMLRLSPAIRSSNAEVLARARRPLPPARLAFAVAGTPDLAWFDGQGARDASTVRRAFERHGLAGAPAVLDFGCGCGRLARHAPAAWRLTGVDPDDRAIAWCRANLRGTFAANGSSPPLGVPDGSFDAAYALSVFTHLEESQQEAWLHELHRVLLPGGLLAVTTHGSKYGATGGAARERLAKTGSVVARPSRSGTNLCAAYHTPAKVKAMLEPRFEVLEQMTPAGDGLAQDLHLARRV